MPARPGRDVVHLVTVVHNSLQLTQGQQLVLKYLKQVGTGASLGGCVTQKDTRKWHQKSNTCSCRPPSRTSSL